MRLRPVKCRLAVRVRIGLSILRGRSCPSIVQHFGSSICSDSNSQGNALHPLYLLMLARVLTSRVVQCVETRLPVQAVGQLETCRLWQYRGGGLSSTCGSPDGDVIRRRGLANPGGKDSSQCSCGVPDALQIQ
jgi:hypothetical protein